LEEVASPGRLGRERLTEGWTLRIEHVALWVSDLERARRFYEGFFGARAGGKYANPHKAFESYFLSFASGARLEIMRRPELAEGVPDSSPVGFSHIAFSLGSVEQVDRLTERLRAEGHAVVDGPRWTGDGYLAIGPGIPSTYPPESHQWLQDERGSCKKASGRLAVQAGQRGALGLNEASWPSPR